MTHTQYKKNTNGFTLIELSIVIVIIGFIVGGVLLALDMVEASQIRSQISQIEKFKTAVYSFRNKYGYLPGDIPPSQTTQLGFFTFTGTYAGKAFSTSTRRDLYAFGNNDGRVNETESYAFWQHLGEAKMIEGTYGGVRLTTGDHLRTSTSAANNAGANMGGVPVSSLDADLDFSSEPDKLVAFEPTAKLFVGSALYAGAANTIDAYSTYYEYYGNPTPNKAYYWANNTALKNLFSVSSTTAQNYAIDLKMDDGLPLTGVVRELWTDWNVNYPPVANNPPCTTGTYPNFTYDMTQSTKNIIWCLVSFLW